MPCPADAFGELLAFLKEAIAFGRGAKQTGWVLNCSWAGVKKVCVSEKGSPKVKIDAATFESPFISTCFEVIREDYK